MDNEGKLPKEKLTIEDIRNKYSSSNSVGDDYKLNFNKKNVDILIKNNNSRNNYHPFVSLTNNQLKESIFEKTGYQFQDSLALTLFRNASIEDRAKMIFASYQDKRLSPHKLEFLIHLTEELTKERLPAMEVFEEELQKINYENNFDYPYTKLIEEPLNHSLHKVQISQNKIITEPKIECSENFDSKNSELENLEEEKFIEDNSRAQKTLFQEMLSSDNFRQLLNAVSQNQTEVVSLMLEIADSNTLYEMLDHKNLTLPDLKVDNVYRESANNPTDNLSMFNLLWNCAETLEKDAPKLQNKLLAQDNFELLKQISENRDFVSAKQLCNKILLMDELAIETQRVMANFAQSIFPDLDGLDKIITATLLIKKPQDLEKSPENEVFLSQLENLRTNLQLDEIEERFVISKNIKINEIQQSFQSSEELEDKIDNADKKNFTKKAIIEIFDNLLTNVKEGKDLKTGSRKITYCKNLTEEPTASEAPKTTVTKNNSERVLSNSQTKIL